jgi:hypothetical protein
MKVLLRNGHHGSQNTRHVTTFFCKHFNMAHIESNTTFFNNHVVFTVWVYVSRHEFKITTFCSVRPRSVVARYCLTEHGWRIAASRTLLTAVPYLSKYTISAQTLLTSHSLCNRTAQTFRKILPTNLHDVTSCITIQRSPPPSVIATDGH